MTFQKLSHLFATEESTMLFVIMLTPHFLNLNAHFSTLDQYKAILASFFYPFPPLKNLDLQILLAAAQAFALIAIHRRC